MYKAKGEERNAFRFFTPEMNAEAVERMEMEHHLRHALEKKNYRFVTSLWLRRNPERSSGLKRFCAGITPR